MTTLVGYWAENDADCMALHGLVAQVLPEQDLKDYPRPSPCGWKGVVRGVRLFLQEAAHAGCGLVIIAIDNDGGAQRCPEHEVHHVPPPVDVADGNALNLGGDGCRECLLLGQIPSNSADVVICVPVQALETWLIVAADKSSAFPNATPEANYNRPQLKKYFGSRDASADKREALARAALETPGALDRLRQRPSFSRFEERLRAWEKTRVAAP